MMQKVVLFVRHNPYDMYRYFTKLLGEALMRYGSSVTIIDVDSSGFNEAQLKKALDPSKTDLTIAFASVYPRVGDQFIWEKSKIPHLFILNDSVAPFRDIVTSKNLILAHVDKFECEVARSIGVSDVFFLPHAVDQKIPDAHGDRPYDVVFCAGSYDHETIQRIYRKESPEIISIIEEAIELSSSESMAVFSGVRQAVENKGRQFSWDDLMRLNYIVDAYIRGKDRYELVKSVKEASVLVIGGTIWDYHNIPLRGWAELLKDMPNVHFKPSVDYEGFLNILRQSKIALNSAPHFKNSAHERFLNSLACGAMPITTENIWVKEHFVDGEELILYHPRHKESLNETVNSLLGNEKKRLEIVEKGRLKVMQKHTWDNRIFQIKSHLEKVKNHD